MLHPVYDQPDAASGHAQYDRLEAVTVKRPKAAAPSGCGPRRRARPHRVPRRKSGIRSGPTIRSERLNGEIRRRTDVVGIFPACDALSACDLCLRQTRDEAVNR